MDNLCRIRPKGISRILLWLFIFSFAFDFKGEEGGSPAQVVFLAIALFSGMGYLILPRSRPSGGIIRGDATTLVLMFLWAFIISSGITASIMVIPLARYARVLLPLLRGLSATVAVRAIRDNVDIDYLGKVIFWAAAVSLAWTFTYSMFVIGHKISEIRYQIVTPMAPYILAYGAWAFATKRRLSFVYNFVIVIMIALIIVSITRAYIIVAMLVWIAYLTHGRRILLGRIVTSTGIMGIMIVVGIIIAVMLRSDVLDSWNHRLFDQLASTNIDITALTRLAEYSGQWHALTSGPLSMLIGKGLGSEYAWDSSYMDVLSSVLGGDNEVGIYEWNGGHSLWIYSLYSGGILFGWIIPCVFLMCLYQAFLSIRRRHLYRPRLESAVYLPYFVLMAFIGISFTSHPLMFRENAVVLGFIFVWAAWFYSLSNRALSTRNNL